MKDTQDLEGLVIDYKVNVKLKETIRMITFFIFNENNEVPVHYYGHVQDPKSYLGKLLRIVSKKSDNWLFQQLYTDGNLKNQYEGRVDDALRLYEAIIEKKG